MLSTIVGEKTENAVFVLCDCKHEILGYFRRKPSTSGGAFGYLACYSLPGEPLKGMEKPPKDKAPCFYFATDEEAIQFARTLFSMATSLAVEPRSCEFLDTYCLPDTPGVLRVQTDGKTVDISKYVGKDVKLPTWEVILTTYSASCFAQNMLATLSRRI